MSVRDIAACVILGAFLVLPCLAWSQTPAPPPPAMPPPPPSCEVQLAEAQRGLIQLRKSEAEWRFRAASVEEVALGLQQRIQELTPKPDAKPEGKK